MTAVILLVMLQQPLKDKEAIKAASLTEASPPPIITGISESVYLLPTPCESTEPEQTSEPKKEDVASVRYQLTDLERQEIERIVASEGGYCSYTFQALVATCILNSCEAESIRPLEIFERGDFWLTNDVEPTETTKKAVADVFDNGILPTNEKIRYYYNPEYCESAAHETFCYVLTNTGCRFFKDWTESE